MTKKENKYIDVDKLKAEIERFSATEFGDNTLGDDVAKGALDYVLEEIIPSLQQEQPKVDLEEEFHRWLSKEKEEWGGEIPPYGDYGLFDIARHFYELGLDARKED